jgi:hypothetical protein
MIEFFDSIVTVLSHCVVWVDNRECIMWMETMTYACPNVDDLLKILSAGFGDVFIFF